MILVFDTRRSHNTREEFSTLKEAVKFYESFPEEDQQHLIINVDDFFPESTRHEGASFVPPNNIYLYNEGGFCSTSFTLDQVENFVTELKKVQMEKT